jgi:2-C-methyl-D-erythritol 4-phosphate cytidylyltransferase
MIFAIILAGGKGTRMGISEIPKQLLNLGEKPILIHCVEKFLMVPEIDKIIIACPQEWISHISDIIKKFIFEESKINIIAGGTIRNETVLKGLNYINNTYSVTDDDIVLTHDAVRPFVSYRIIKENIEMCKKYGAVDTVIPATDTIVKSLDGIKLSDIPFRAELYQGQTPQSFKVNLLLKSYNNVSKIQLETATDVAGIVMLNGYGIYMVNGEIENMKITTSTDLIYANAILCEGIK